MKQGFLTRNANANRLWVLGVILLFLSAIQSMLFPAGEVQLPQVKAFEAFSGLEIFGYPIMNFFGKASVNHVFRFLLLLGCGLLLQYISQEFRLIRVRSFFPLFLFLVFSATILPMLPLNGSSISCFFFIWACLRLFNALESGETNRSVFDAFVLLAVASIFQSRLLYLLPVIWLVMGILQVFNLKSFFASLLGVLSVFWVIGGFSFLYGNYDFLLLIARNLIGFELIDITKMSAAEISYTSFLGVLMISAMFSFWPRQHLDKLRTRNYLNSVLLIWFVLLGLWLFSGNDMGYLLILLSLSALVVAHFFSLVDNLYARILFFLFLILSVTVYFLF
jgi:hypothetical protein